MSVFVHTSHGQGRVVDEQTVRGRKSFLVEGSSFKVWVDEKDLRVAYQWGGGDHVNDDNSTSLPYDPSPQYPVDMFKTDSTIQPGEQEIDPDERLSPADSVSLNSSGEHEYPGPSPDNFAKNASRYAFGPGDFGTGRHALPFTKSPDDGYEGRHRRPPSPEMDLGNGQLVWDSRDWAEVHPEQKFEDPREQARYDEWADKYLGRSELNDRMLYTYEPIYASREEIFEHLHPEDEEEPEIKHFSSLHTAAGYTELADDAIDVLEDSLGGGGRKEEGGEKPRKNPNEVNDQVQHHLNPVKELADDFAGPQVKKNVGGWWPGRPDGQTVTSSYRPAGLSDKYIRIAGHTDHYSDPVQQFRDDPVSFIQKRAYALEGSADIRLAEYVDLVDSDPHIRTAAWKDVRAKALRLRREGRVHVKDISPTRIYAAVDGDNDTYETMIVKSSANQSIDSWTCNCGWGSTVGQRKVSYVGRLCSHGYASYLEMESQQMKANNKRRKRAASDEAQTSEEHFRLRPQDSDTDYDAWKSHQKDLNEEPEWNHLKRSRIAGIVEDFKQWAKDENNGKIDEGALANFIYLCNSELEGEQAYIDEEDAEKLYDALDSNRSNGKVRNYDVGYDPQPDKHYKEADVLHLRPRSLTPDMTFIEDGDGQEWVDVTKDERKTTGPDQVMRKEAGPVGNFIRNVVKKDKSDLLSRQEAVDWYTSLQPHEKNWIRENYPDHYLVRMDNKVNGFDSSYRHSSRALNSRRMTAMEIRYASDEELGKKVKDWNSAGSDLNKLRDLSSEAPDLQNMRDRNEEIRDVIDELHDRGIDASQFVAALRTAADEEASDAEDDDKKKNTPPPASTQGQPDMSGKPSETGQPGGSSSITKPEATTTATPTSSSSDSNKALSNPTKDPNGVGFGGGPAASAGSPSPNAPEKTPQMDSASALSSFGQAAGGLGNMLPNLINSIGPQVIQGISQLGTGIGTGLSSLATGLGNLGGLLHRAEKITSSYHYAAGFPNVQLTNQESFQGSGPDPKYWMESSECYVDDHERQHMVDLTDLDEDPLIKFVSDKPGQGPKKASRRPLASEESRNNLLQAEGEELEAIGLYSQMADEARDSGDDYAAGALDEAILDEQDHAHNFNEALKHASDNANPEGSTLTSGYGYNDTMATPFDQVRKAGAFSPNKAWDGHRIRDFKKFMRQKGSQRPNHQILQEYLQKPHRNLGQGGTQHLQDYTAYAEQHEASRRYADDEMIGMGMADVPDSSSLMPTDAESYGVLASREGDSSDIVAQFHRMGGIEAINSSGGGGTYSDSAIAERAQGFLKSAGRVFSLAEQRELESESHPEGARNLKGLNLTGTHYEDV